MKKKETKESMGSDSSGSFESSLSNKPLKKTIKQQEIDEVTDASSSGSYDAPFGNGSKNPLKIGGVDSIKKSRAVVDKNFPKFGGPDAVFVKVKEHCKKFPYCNQGDMNALELYEIEGIKEAIDESAKKYNLPIKEVENIILNEIQKQIKESLPKGMLDDGNIKALRSWSNVTETHTYQISTEEPLNFVIDRESDFLKLKQIFYRYDINFTATEQ